MSTEQEQSQLDILKGTVLWGAKNIFTVDTPAGKLECRFKGKVLSGDIDTYNPLSPGDRVEVEVASGLSGDSIQDSPEASSGMILSRLERTNEFSRWNKKRQGMQTIAANIDELVILTSPASPPFRPRFIDRALALGEYNDLQMHIVVNKADQGIDEELEERLEYYQSIGYRVSAISVHEHIGVDELVAGWKGKRVVLLGQSGVGKSSLVKAIVPEEEIRTGEISGKYNRGRHTTVLAMSYIIGDGCTIIDTPGIRELDLYGMAPEDLAFWFVDFLPFAEKCPIKGCRHVHEPECAVKDAVADGEILEDRYDSYINSLIVMEQSARQMKDWKFKKL